MINILLVEDDPIIGRGLEINLKSMDYNVFWKKTLKEAIYHETHNISDLVILDLNLPDGNGFSFCEAMRNKKSKTPIIILTASIEEEVAVKSFELGARDYVRKPFGNQELMARVKSSLSIAQNNEEKLRFGGLTMVVNLRTVYFDKVEIKLKNKEFDILKIFLERPGHIISREQFIEEIGSHEILDRTIDSHLSHIRSKIKKSGVNGVKIKSVYGVGYKIEKE